MRNGPRGASSSTRLTTAGAWDLTHVACVIVCGPRESWCQSSFRTPHKSREWVTGAVEYQHCNYIDVKNVYPNLIFCNPLHSSVIIIIQIKLVISGAGDKVAGAASDASKKLASVTGDKKGATKTEPLASTTSSDSLPSTCPSLTKKQRLIGFASCFVLGYIVSFGSTFALIAGSDNGTKFGITYTLGNIISLCGSGFLVGPKQQVKLMFKPVRRIATIIYLLMIVVVFTVALAAPELGLVVLLLVIIQCAAAAWYSASYIPYGRKIITGIAKKLCGSV